MQTNHDEMGQLNAFEAAAMPYRSELLRAAVFMLGNRAEAEDLVQTGLDHPFGQCGRAVLPQSRRATEKERKAAARKISSFFPLRVCVPLWLILLLYGGNDDQGPHRSTSIGVCPNTLESGSEKPFDFVMYCSLRGFIV